MCGISGVIGLGMARDQLVATTSAMADALEHRGPDSGGAWVDPDFPIGLGFRRLAILDLSPTGSQPMHSASGRWSMVFNGEIYNHAALRRRLPGSVRLRGTSDSEVLLEAVDEWGLSETLRRADGMYAVALWDRIARRLILARDRFGEKPLYYGWSGSAFLFGSELKALHAHPGFDARVDRRALELMLRLDYVPAPHCIYESVRKLPPGCFVTIDPDAPGAEVTPTEYWSAARAASDAATEGFDGTRAEAADEVERVLAGSVRRRMVADVPLGAFLSGGIDSSLVVALMQRAATKPVQTFTVGFEDPDYDESSYARRVATHLGTEHVDVRLRPAEVLSVLPELPTMYDEPFADSSQVPMHLVARLARQSVTVALSGDGGDELFGGYSRHVELERVWSAVRRIPAAARPALGRALTSVPPHRWDELSRLFAPALPARLRPSHPGDKVHKLARGLTSGSPGELYDSLISSWPPGATPVAAPLRGAHDALPHDVRQPSGLAQQTMLRDTLGYLPGDILTKVDRATMAVGLEARVPLLDPELFRLAWRLPLEYKIGGGSGKLVLRDVLRRHVPDALFERPKMGFALPLSDWLRGPLRPWAEDLLSPSRLRGEGYLDPGPLTRAWDQHLRGERDNKDLLWGPLMFQAWRDRWAS